MPALMKTKKFEFAGIGMCAEDEIFANQEMETCKLKEILAQEKEKAQVFIDMYGGKLYSSYKEIIESTEIDALYIPLPPGLHYKWARKALENGKHVLVEKPSTILANDTRKLVEIARKKGLALHENYMFVFHEQLRVLQEYVNAGNIGDIRLIRISFGFPKRKENDFRYNQELGGGALIDAGGYVIKYAAMLLGDSAHIKTAQMNYNPKCEVDMYGSATMVNNEGMVAQLAFGMDNSYKCDLEIWGSKGNLFSGRILTAPAGFVPNMIITSSENKEKIELPADDTFLKSIEYFGECICNDSIREQEYKDVIRQAEHIEEFRKAAV